MLTRRQSLAVAAGGLLIPLIATPHLVWASVIYVDDAVAIDGSDPVAYFDNNGPVAGDPSITTTWNGATWRFASTANRDAFVADPERWAPQYGGYCAYAMSRGYVAATVPEAWTIDSDRLYLNFSLDVRNLWNRDRAQNIALGDENWPMVRDTLV